MKKTFHKSSIFVLFWASIILLSSCHIRKALDAFWGIPFQKSLNVSKANLNPQTCISSIDYSAFSSAIEDLEEENKQLNTCFLEKLQLSQLLPSNQLPLHLNKEYIEINSPPFYIQFQRLKIPA